MASQAGNFNIQEFSDLGALLVGGRLYTYTQGTTTQKTAYTDAAGAVPHTYTSDGLGGQYIALNSRGELPAPLYLAAGAYDLALKRADGSTVWTRRADPTGDLVAPLAASSGASLIGWILQATGAIVRLVSNKLSDRVSLLDFATGDGTTNDSAAIQSAITYCAANGKVLEITAPPVAYNMTTAIVSTVMCSMIGEGATKSLFKWSGAAGGIPFTFNLGTQANFISLKDFAIGGATVGNGLNGMVINMTSSGGVFANSEISGLEIYNFTSYGLICDNSLAAISAFFCLNIERNYICNGFKAIKFGDSNNIMKNNISMTSDTVGQTCIGLWITGMSGAAQLQIGFNNVTSGGGAMVLDGCDQARWYGNQLEFPYYRQASGLTNFPFTSNANNGNAMVRIVNSYGVLDGGNNINTGYGSSNNTCAGYSVFFDGTATKHCTLRGSSITRGSQYHVNFDNGAIGNIVGKNNWQSTAAPLINMTTPWTYPQVGVMMPVTLINGWVLDTANGETAVNFLLGEDGIGHLFGAVDGGAGVVATLPAVVVPTQYTRNLNMYHSSAGSVLVLDTGGTLQISTSPGSGSTLNGMTFPYRLAL